MISRPIVRNALFCAASVFCGWVAAFSMPPASLWPLIFAGISGLYILFSRTRGAGQAFAAGFFFALGYFVTGLWWIGNALLVEGNEFAWVWPISVIGLPTLLALFTGTYLGIARMAGDPEGGRGFAAFALFLCFSEWTRGHAFTGFPWNLYGYAWADHLPMAQMAHYTGAYGMTLITLLWAALPGFLWISTASRKRKALTASAALFSLALVFAGGSYRLGHAAEGSDESVGLVVVQPNIAQNMKWDPVAMQDNFLKLISLSRAGLEVEPKPSKTLIVWPETALSPAAYSTPGNMEKLRDMLASYKGTDAYLITGILLRDGPQESPRYANSVLYLDKNLNSLSRYDKYHLVPFGEFIPFQKWIPLAPVAAYKGFERGHGAHTVSLPGLPPSSPLICYEVIFPDEVTDKTSPARPRWIVNVTNDGWYGDSAGPHQHFAQTRLRAIEEGLPVIRAANTGISGVIDPYGRVLERADIFQEASLIRRLPLPLVSERAPWWPWALQAALFFLGLAWIILIFAKISCKKP